MCFCVRALTKAPWFRSRVNTSMLSSMTAMWSGVKPFRLAQFTSRAFTLLFWNQGHTLFYTYLFKVDYETSYDPSVLSLLTAPSRWNPSQRWARFERREKPDLHLYTELSKEASETIFIHLWYDMVRDWTQNLHMTGWTLYHSGTPVVKFNMQPILNSSLYIDSMKNKWDRFYVLIPRNVYNTILNLCAHQKSL